MEAFDRDLFRLIRLSADFMGSRKCFNTLVVSQAEINVIAGIHRQAPCSLKGLAETLNITSSACSQQVERLVQKNYVERVTDPQDRRGVRLALTKSGQAVMQAYDQCRQSIVETVHKKLRGQDKNASAAAIKAVADALETKIREL